MVEGVEAWRTWRVTFDVAKNDRNVRDRGLPFDLVADIDWTMANVSEDARKDHGEPRFLLLGLLNRLLHVAVIALRPKAARVVSFRKANEKEIRRYGEERRRSGVPS